jgi:hypothetical protein
MSLKGANLNNPLTPGPKWLCHFLPGVEIKIRQVPERLYVFTNIQPFRDLVFLLCLSRVCLKLALLTTRVYSNWPLSET